MLLFFAFNAFLENRERILRASAIQEAQSKYERSLEALRIDPSNQTLRQATLQAGREYVQIAARIDLFSETVLMNDLNAIPPTGNRSEPPPIPSKTAKERLEELNALYSEGLISKGEYESRRNNILGAI